MTIRNHTTSHLSTQIGIVKREREDLRSHALRPIKTSNVPQ